MNTIASENQEHAKQHLNEWMDQRKISLTDFARAMDYRYTWAWSLVRGKAPITAEFVGRMLAAYGPEAAQMISDALNGAAAEQASA